MSYTQFYTTKKVRKAITHSIEGFRDTEADEGEIHMDICRTMATLVGQSSIDAFSVKVTCHPNSIIVEASWVPYSADFWEAYTFVSTGSRISVKQGVGRKINWFGRTRRYFTEMKRRLGYVIAGHTGEEQAGTN